MFRTAVCLVTIALAAGVAAAQEPAVEASDVRVGVVVELTVNVSPDRAEALGAALADALHRELEVDAIGGGDVTRRLPENGVPEECIATKGCVADLAGRLDVNELLFLAVVQVGADIHIDSSWVNVATGEVLSRPRVELLADARAGEVFSAAATRLLPHARKRPLAAVVMPPGKPTGPDRHFTAGVWIAGGLGLAAAGGATLFGLQARSKYNECEQLECDQAGKDDVGRTALYADIMIGAAIAGTATAVVLYLRSDRNRNERAKVTTPPEPATAFSVAPLRGGAFAELRVGF
jgi:hypothetical protein